MAKARDALAAEPLSKAVAKGRAALDAKPLARFASDAKAAFGIATGLPVPSRPAGCQSTHWGSRSRIHQDRRTPLTRNTLTKP